jgi:hypothetical protein
MYINNYSNDHRNKKLKIIFLTTILYFSVITNVFSISLSYSDRSNENTLQYDDILSKFLPITIQKIEAQELDKSLNANDDANEVINQKSVDVQFEGFYNSNYGRFI